MSASAARVAAAVVGLSGASLGAGAVVAWERILLEAGPPGWTTTLPELPVVLASLSGPPALPGDGWPLASHAVLTPVSDPGTGVSVTARLPPGGHLELRLHPRDRGPSAALLVDRGEVPYAMVVGVVDGAGERGKGSRSEPKALACDLPLEPPSSEEVSVQLIPDGPVVVATVESGGQRQVARCRYARRAGAVSVRSGVRRIGLRSVATPAEGVRASEPAWASRAAWGGGLAVLMGLLSFFAVGKRGLRPARAVLPALPLLAILPLSLSDLGAAFQAIRVVLAQPLWAALVLPGAASVAVVLGILWTALARSERRLSLAGAGGLGGLLGAMAVPGYGLVGLVGLVLGAALAVGIQRALPRLGAAGLGPTPGALLGALVAGGGAAALGPSQGMAVTLAALAGSSLGALVWVNVARPRGWNPASLLLFCLAVGLCNEGLRWTELGARLTGRSARADDGGAAMLGGTFSSFEALEHRREWQDYPLQDYPVEPADRRAGSPRIVAMGGSSTGGAWQNDKLDQFWPAELERSAGGAVQVVNLGVGGWTTFHIRRFLETQLEVADPDVLVLYIGHNDILTASPRPYNALFEAWRAGGSADLALSGALARVPLYQLARFGLQAAAGRNTGAAVPVSDARQNLRRIIELLDARGARLLLTREGIAPDPSALDPYGDMLAELAASHDSVAYVDIAGQLSGPGAAGVFIDDCHLTQSGHAKVAGLVRQGLVDASWLTDAP